MRCTILSAAVCVSLLSATTLFAQTMPGLYWTDTVFDKIQYANLDGSNVTDLVTTGLQHPHRVDVTADYVYWADYHTGKIQRANPDGTGITDLVHHPTLYPRGLDVTDNFIYWVSDPHRKIQRSNLDGSGVMDLVTFGYGGPTGISVTDNHIYWANYTSDDIWRCDLDGANSIVVSDWLQIYASTHVVATDDYIYYSGGGIWRVDADGSNKVRLVAAYAEGLAVTDSHLYWADPLASKIMMANLDGTGITDLVTGLDSARGLAVAPIPEPSSLILLCLGAFALLGFSRSRRR